MQSDVFAAEYAAAIESPTRYAADKQTIESLLKTVREDPYEGLNHGVLADALDEQYGPHPLHEFIRQHGMNGANTDSMWWEPYNAGYDGTWSEKIPVGEHSGFRFLLGREGPHDNSNSRWVVHAQPWKVKNRQLRDDAYTMELDDDAIHQFADDAKLPAIKPLVGLGKEGFDAKASGYYEGKPEQLSRRSEQPVRYGKAKKRLKVHPLLRGTRLAIALKELAKGDDRTAAALARRTLTVDPGTTLVLADHLEESGHPMASLYNWRAVPEKLTQDAKTLQIVRRLAVERRQANANAGHPQRLLHAANGVLSDVRDSHGLGYNDARMESRGRVVAALRSSFPHITDEHIDDSLARVHRRVTDRMWNADPELAEWMRTQKRRDALTPLEQKHASVDNWYAKEDADRPPSQYTLTKRQQERQQREALHFARLRVSGISAALRLLRSRNQRQTRSVASEVLSKLGLEPSKLRDAVTASGAPVASVLAAIYHGGNEAASEAAAAWFGHLLQLPSVTAFHSDADGPDSLYKLTLPLDPAKAADFLQSHGVGRVVLAPNGDSTDAVIHDPGSKLGSRVAKAAAAANLSEVQVTRGRSVRLGGNADGQRPTGEGRKSYRDTISAFEATNGSNSAR